MHYSIINKLFYLSSLFFKLTDLYTSSFWPIPKREEFLNSLAFSCIYVSSYLLNMTASNCKVVSYCQLCGQRPADWRQQYSTTFGAWQRAVGWTVEAHNYVYVHCTHIVILTAWISDVWRLCYLKPSSLFRRWYNGLGWFQMFVTYVTHFSTSKVSIFETIDLATEP